MATLLHRIYQGYLYINDELSDPRTGNYLFMSSPWTTLAIVGFYLYFVRDLGPTIMMKREPFKLEKVMQLYNVTQIIICAYIFYKAMVLAWLDGHNIICEPVNYSTDPKSLEKTRVVWLFFIVKLLDLLDTVFFVLRKKGNQISFLHIYHHAGMAFGTWATTKFLPGGHLIFLGTVNSFVHVVMYSHYLATSLRIGRTWWKKYITQLQMIQFAMLLIHYVVLVFVEDCGFPKWTAAVLIPQNVFMMVLFGDFYYKTYIKKKTPKVSQNGVGSEAANGKPKSQ
ncbi:very long chain fatty acid elongase 7 [Nomia melanderi]|uniref:very long chain fatty acid elongase 7 n=1 Tax=Nomia melanderi TaxID=2448451 RepID=UPI001303FA1B|nr:elongation of very long chain fatty acids protein-like [Nomia melanderi]